MLGNFDFIYILGQNRSLCYCNFSIKFTSVVYQSKKDKNHSQTSRPGVYQKYGDVSPHLHVGFVHPLQDVALHQCLPLSSLCCFPNSGGSLLLCYVILPSSAWSSSRPLPSPWLPLCAVLVMLCRSKEILCSKQNGVRVDVLHADTQACIYLLHGFCHCSLGSCMNPYLKLCATVFISMLDSIVKLFGFYHFLFVIVQGMRQLKRNSDLSRRE